MKNRFVSILMLVCWLSVNGMLMAVGIEGKDNFDKRFERNIIDWEAKTYTYSRGDNGKTIPVYNFGLGKRSAPYSSGLGKRSDYGDRYTQVAKDLDGSTGRREQWNEPRQLNRYGFGIGRR